jgi:hypothetical protein
MTVAALPDLAGAITSFLRAQPEIAALAGTRISSARQETWNLPNYAILIQPGRGGPGEVMDGLLLAERVDLWFYGPDARTAGLLWRTTHPIICPRVGKSNGFTAASTRVTKVAQEGGPLRLVDPDENWSYTVASYIFTYNPDPVS